MALICLQEDVKLRVQPLLFRYLQPHLHKNLAEEPVGLHDIMVPAGTVMQIRVNSLDAVYAHFALYHQNEMYFCISFDPQLQAFLDAFVLERGKGLDDEKDA